jgi:hypothetical protein
MDSVASLQGVTFDTLTVPDKKSIICCILKVIATNQRRCCRTQAIRQELSTRQNQTWASKVLQEFPATDGPYTLRPP